MPLDDAKRRFLDFMTQREQLRITKESGAPWPWSSDPILNAYKFTNVKREDDRTTRWMRKNWTVPNDHRPDGEIIFNCALFRYFGTVEFAEAIGWQTSYSAERTILVADSRRARGEVIFTGAYIIPTLGVRQPKHLTVCRTILEGVWAERDALANVAKTTLSWKDVASALRRLPGFGGTGFLAKEVLQDVMQTRILRGAIDRNTWCPAGPGARRGLNRLADRPLDQSVPEKTLLMEMSNLFEIAQSNVPDFMPELELHDIQFQLCEFDKYERVRLGEGRPKARYHPPSILNKSEV